MLHTLILLTLSSVLIEDHPLAAEVRPQLKDVNQPFTLVVTVKLKANMEGKFLEAMKPAIVATRKEKGNIAYFLNQDKDNASEFMLYERWANLAALDSHLKSEPIGKLLAALGEVLDGAPTIKVMKVAGE